MRALRGRSETGVSTHKLFDAKAFSKGIHENIMSKLSKDKSPVFLRDATGLIREISVLQSFLLNFSFLAIWLSYPTYTTGNFVFPGSDLVLATVIATVLSVIFISMWTLFAVAMPRSGGDYVFTTRVLHPLIGFITNFTLCFTFIWFSGLGATLATSTALAPSMVLIGTLTGNQFYVNIGNALTQPIYVEAITAPILVILGLIMAGGVRLTARINAVLMIMTFGDIALMLGLMATNTTASFVSDFSRFGNYSQVISAAHSAGYSPTTQNPFLATLGVTPFVLIGTLFGFGAHYWSGEIKSMKKNLWISQVLMTAVTGAILTVFAYLVVNTFGYDFIGSISYLFNTGSSAYPLTVPLFPNVLISMLTTNSVLLWAITIGFIASTVGPVIGVYMVVSRAIFAWSFDRLIPGKFGSVSERFHTPVYAIRCLRSTL